MIIDNLEDFNKAMQEKRNYPKGLQLQLGINQVGDEGAKVLATALQSGNCPQGFKLDLSNDRIGDEGAKAFATALQSRNCPRGLQLSILYNRISDEGAKVLATALQSGNCPQGLQLYLWGNPSWNNRISDEGARAFATALQSGNCPQGLWLSLQYNRIGNEGAKAFVTALQSGNCPQRLWLDLRYNHQIDDEGAKALKEAWNTYQREYFLRCIALQQGQRQIGSPVSQLPQDILNEIYSYLAPTVPISAKMTEISAKVFRQSYNSCLFSEKSLQANRLDHALATALSAGTLTESVKAIKGCIDNFLKEELGTFKTGKFAKSTTIALLCKYHLVTGDKVKEDPHHPDYFQLREPQSKKLIQ